MGVDTNAILSKSTKVTDIVKHISDNFDHVELHTHKSVEYYFTITFKDGTDNRNLSVFTDYSISNRDYGIPGILISLSHWGNSVEIMKYILDEFGGYIDEDDSDDVPFLPYKENSESFNKFKNDPGLSDLDIFKQEVLSQVGLDLLDDVMNLCEYYRANGLSIMGQP